MKLETSFGTRLQNAREFRNYETQKELADKVGVTKGTWSQYESDNRSPSLETFKRIAQILDVSADYLLGFKEEKTVNSKEEV